MRFFRAKYGAGILTGLMAAAVVCLAIGGYQAYSQTLQAQQELEQLKQTVRQKEDELDHLSDERQLLAEQMDELEAETGGLRLRGDFYQAALSGYEAAAKEVEERSGEGMRIMSELAVQQEVARLQECAFSMDYEEKDGKLTLENGLIILNEGVDERYPELCALYLNFVPQKILDRMAEEGWIIHMYPGVAGTGSYQGEDEEYAGMTYYDERKIDIAIEEDLDELPIRSTLLHEIGHVVDSYEDYASYEKPFTSCYQKEKSLFLDIKWNEYHAEYVAREAAEYYAETLMVYWLAPDYLRYQCSDTFEYFEKMSSRWE